MRKWNINKVTYCAIRDWTEHKTIKTFKLVYNFAFLGGNPVWRTWRIIRNTLKSTYKEMIKDYEKTIDN